MKYLLLLLLSIFIITCTNRSPERTSEESSDVFITVLGIAQDAGYPQAGCKKEQCQLFWNGKEEARHATSLALVDSNSDKFWMFEATPDIKHQLRAITTIKNDLTFAGIFLTHAHIGHYTGLMHLGHEAMGAKQIPVFTMPRMAQYLSTNGPWSQLVDFENINLTELRADSALSLTDGISVTPFWVPHRDEFSETVGYRITSPNKAVLFIPDINKWEVWDRDIIEEIAKVDIAFLDATFFDANELPGRNMADIPHPFVEESLNLFADLPDSEKEKITFIHFNHTNPLLLDSPERALVESMGFKVAYEGMNIAL